MTIYTGIILGQIADCSFEKKVVNNCLIHIVTYKQTIISFIDK